MDALYCFLSLSRLTIIQSSSGVSFRQSMLNLSDTSDILSQLLAKQLRVKVQIWSMQQKMLSSILFFPSQLCISSESVRIFSYSWLFMSKQYILIGSYFFVQGRPSIHQMTLMQKAPMSCLPCMPQKFSFTTKSLGLARLAARSHSYSMNLKTLVFLSVILATSCSFQLNFACILGLIFLFSMAALRLWQRSSTITAFLDSITNSNIMDCQKLPLRMVLSSIQLMIFSLSLLSLSDDIWYTSFKCKAKQVMLALSREYQHCDPFYWFLSFRWVYYRNITQFEMLRQFDMISLMNRY